jgi:hypothetical protein
MVVVSRTIPYWGWLGLPLTPFERRLVWLRRIECLNCRTIRLAIVPPLSASETP